MNAAAIRALLTPAMVLDYFEVQHRGRMQWAVQLCPACGQLRRGSVSIHAETGLWACHHCGAHGGILDLVGGYAGIDAKKDFHRVLGLAATIAGVPHGVPDEDYAKLLEEHRRKRAEQVAAENAKRARMRARMPSIWQQLDRRSVKGERYLRDRGIDPDPLREHDVVRYSGLGDPAVQLRDLATGDVAGIQYRMLQGDAKLTTQPWSQSAGSCLHGRVADLERTRLAIVVEGLADTLVACLLWPDATVFGAPGTGQLAAVGAAVGAAVARCRGILLIVPDDDNPDDDATKTDVGVKSAALAVNAAMIAGLELVDQARRGEEAKIQIVDLGVDLAGKRHHDLADAWAHSRWRWRWPEDVA